MIETYEEYIERLKNTKKLSKEIRDKAVKRLTVMRNWARSKNAKIDKLDYVKFKKNPYLCEMFDWGATKEGRDFWQKIADAGF